MSYTSPTTRTTGDLITASIWNTDIVDNFQALWVYAEEGDVAMATSAAAIAAVKVPKILAIVPYTTIYSTDSTNSQSIIDYTVPGGTLGINNMIRITGHGYANFATTSPAGSVFFSISYSTVSQTLWSFSPASAQGQPISYIAHLSALGADNSEALSYMRIAEASLPVNASTDGAIDSSTDQTLSLSVSITDTANDRYYKNYGAVIELLHVTT